MNYEQMENNKANLSGIITEEPVFSHEVMGEGFYETFIEVKRLSEKTDVIPITVSERLLGGGEITKGSEVGLSGQFRSYNMTNGERSKLVLSFFVREIFEPSSENPNWIEICGYVCKESVYRTTPFGREICDMLVAVNRAYNKSDYLPCIAWGRNARFAHHVPVGEKVRITGRLQSRPYQKQLDNGDIETRVAYEVSIGRIAIEQENE